jgi:AcrR family transcriptional regulator
MTLKSNKKLTETRKRGATARGAALSNSAAPTPAEPEPDTGAVAALKRLNPTQRRSQILAVAEELFARRPYPEINVLDVAEAAGITPGLVYHYFDSKEGLLEAALEASAGRLLLASLPDSTLSIPRQWELGLKGYLDHVLAHRTAYINLFRGPAAHEPGLQRIAERTRQTIIEHAMRVLGLNDRTTPATRLSLRGYLGYVESVILDWLEHESVPRATLERMIFKVVLAAVTAGFDADPNLTLTPRERAQFEAAYREHFHLT